MLHSESFCWLSYFPCLLGDALPAYLLLIPQNLFSKSCSAFCGRCHFSSFFCFYRFCYGKKKKKSLSVRIDRSLAFISGACYEHSTGDMEIGHALKNGVFEVCLEEGCERVEHVCWKWKILKTIFFYWSEKSLLSVCETEIFQRAGIVSYWPFLTKTTQERAMTSKPPSTKK